MKKLTYLFYFLLVLVIFSIIVLTNDSANKTLTIIAYICLGVVALLVLLSFIIAKLLIKQNNDLFKYIENEKYEELITIVDNKLKHLLFKSRTNYLYYLKIVALLSLNKEEQGYELINKVTNKDNFPVLIYYKALIDFNNKKYDNLENDLIAFKNTSRYITNQEFYHDYELLLESILAYKEDSKKALELLQKASSNKFTMPCSLKAIETIKTTL